eukprot:gnl/Hemi2/8931_TR3098_c0_g1_i1.p1 gnl/Hemi2/8931_TR3098_c0_g1~~gnl/Hemi2/8931_TR3098_c0_g1_i1.p1  ORF type:complete len:458 (-),score=60.57 gnl/Hemi2/8931_TR3098_c0_g1_i1:167-1540(-)
MLGGGTFGWSFGGLVSRVHGSLGLSAATVRAQTFLHHTTLALPLLEHFGSRELSALVQAYTTSGYWPALLEKIALRASQQLESFRPVDLFRLLRSYFSLDMHDHDLYEQAGSLLAPHVVAFPSRSPRCLTIKEVCELVWIFGRFSHSHPALLEVSSARLLSDPASLSQTSDKDLVRLAGAYALLHTKNDGLFAAIATAAAPRMQHFTPEYIAGLAWSFASVGHSGILPLIVNLLTQYDRQNPRKQGPFMPEFSTSHIANIAWALAKMGVFDVPAFDALARAFGKKDHQLFSSQDLTLFVWAFAESGRSNEKLFYDIANAYRSKITSLSPPLIAYTVWSFARAGKFSEYLFNRLAREAETTHMMDAFTPQHLCMLAWSYAKVAQPPTEPDRNLLQQIAIEVEDRSPRDFSAADMAVLRWAYRHCECDEFLAKAESATLSRKVSPTIPQHQSASSLIHC